MDRTIELIVMAQKGDKKARDTLVEENVGLIWSIVKRFTNRGHDTEDLFQIGSIGLLKSIDKFDTSFGVRFSTYAVPMIMGEIRRFLRDDGMIKVSRSLKDIAYRVSLKKDELIKELSREPSISEIAVAIDEEVEDIVVALEANTSIDSLQGVIYRGEGKPITLSDTLESSEKEEKVIVNKLMISQMLDSLEPKEKKIITLRYFRDMTQTQTGKRVGISQVQVSRTEKKILNTMRKMMETARKD